MSSSALPPASLFAAALAHHPTVAAAPPVGWVVLAVVVYSLVAVPLVFLGLQRVDRSNVAWILLPMLALCAAVGLWFLGHDPPGRPAAGGRATTMPARQPIARR